MLLLWYDKWLECLPARDKKKTFTKRNHETSKRSIESNLRPDVTMGVWNDLYLSSELFMAVRFRESEQRKHINWLASLQPFAPTVRRKPCANAFGEARLGSPRRGARPTARPRGSYLSWKVRYRTFPGFFSQMSKLYSARSLLYRRQILQVNRRWKALDEIYKIYMLLQRSDLNISANFRQMFWR